MKRVWFVVVTAVCLALTLTGGAAAAPAENDTCLACHSVGGEAMSEVDFSVGVDRFKCDDCHWYGVHDFDVDHVDQNAAPDYLSSQCNSCHHSIATFPDRPALIGWPASLTPYGWFQTPASPDAAPSVIHDIHVRGSWLRDEAQCGPCHAPAACTACHTEPAPTHTDHADIGTQLVAQTVRIGRTHGDTCPDTYLYATNPATNYDASTAMFVGRTSSGEERSLVRIPLDKIGSAELDSAILTLSRSTGPAFPIRAYRLRRSDWLAASATWNVYRTGAAWGTPGAKSATLDYFASPYSESDSGVFDVTALAAEALSAGDDSLDLLLVDPAPVARRYAGFYSSATILAEKRPVLTAEVRRPVRTYAYGPEPGESLPPYATDARTCTAEACHDPANVANDAYAPTCASCHPARTTPHGYDAATHTSGIGEDLLTGVWPAPGDNATYNPPFSYAEPCDGCHSADLAVEHDKATSSSAGDGCDGCHPTPRGSFGAWDGSCSQGGCHEPGSATEVHGAADTSHAMGSADVVAGCGYIAGTRYSCHYRDLVQEHNRTIVIHEGPQTTETLSTGCVECHASAAFEALGGEWDGSCAACHPENHTVTTSARYTEVYGLHENPSGQYESSDGRSGSNSMDAHGWIRPKPSNPNAAVGCGATTCHTAAYLGGGYPYPSADCSTCHGLNVLFPAPYEGSYDWHSGYGIEYELQDSSMVLDVPGALPADSAVEFMTWFDIESGWDYAYLEISTDGGATFTPLAGTVTSNTDPYGQNLGNGITGQSAGWVPASFDLSAYAGQSVRLRFRMVCDSYIYGRGWLIDALTVGPDGAPVFTDDAETLNPQWTMEPDPYTGVGWRRRLAE